MYSISCKFMLEKYLREIINIVSPHLGMFDVGKVEYSMYVCMVVMVKRGVFWFIF